MLLNYIVFILGIHWPLYKADNPIYYIFNAEGEEDMRADKYGRGPMATSCAFWNDFLPRLRQWGKYNFRFLIFNINL